MNRALDDTDLKYGILALDTFGSKFPSARHADDCTPSAPLRVWVRPETETSPKYIPDLTTGYYSLLLDMMKEPHQQNFEPPPLSGGEIWSKTYVFFLCKIRCRVLLNRFS